MTAWTVLHAKPYFLSKDKEFDCVSRILLCFIFTSYNFISLGTLK